VCHANCCRSVLACYLYRHLCNSAPARSAGLEHGEYCVSDPSFDDRPTGELLRELAWMRERVLQIRLALIGDGRRLIPAIEYLELCRTVDPDHH
jgi:hypothetical protein